MFVCDQNPKTDIGYFYMYLSVIDYRNLYVVLMLFQRLNLLRNEYFSFKTTDICLFFWPIFFIMPNFLSFFTVCREFVADSVIQASGTVEFEDGLRTGVLLGGCWDP